MSYSKMRLVQHFLFVASITASAEESGSFEQAHQGRLLMHVHAFNCCWDRDSRCCHIFTDQILVMPAAAGHHHLPPPWCHLSFLFAVVCVM
uniref:Syntaxin-52-like n=1 Tax=Rhizophora mucronata TaxID=61149 RepID=A0A2P2KAH2_RHIMU